MTKTKQTKLKEEKVETQPNETKDIKIIEKVIENKTIAPQDAFGKLTRPQIELIKKTIAKGASDDELRLFIQVCKGANLNPFLKQVFLVPRWDSKEGKETRAIQVSIDGLRSIAESSGAYAGNDDPIFDGEKEIEYGQKERKKSTVPTKATVTVYKIVEGQRYPFTATSRWDEYYPGEKMGFQWHTRPFLMLGKCAEALALRKAFPKLLSGMYSQEELEKTVPPETPEKKQQTALQKVITMIESANKEELLDYKTKLQNSDKYTKDQKESLMMTIDDRLQKLAKENVNA